MSAAVIKTAAANSATMGTHNCAAAQTVNADDNKVCVNTFENNDGGVFNSDADNNSSFCRLSSIKAEQFDESPQQQQHCNVPLENSLQSRQPTNDEDDAKTIATNFSELNEDDFVDRTQHNRHAAAAEDMDLSSSAEVSPGLSLLQQTAAAASSPPPHSYRHSRAYRHFKNPPQPHMCIRTTTENGEELFINVLSWTRIVIPQEPSDPIPLYGGMRVPPGSPRCPPIVFAVMANPEVLKDSGRHSKDPEERRAMVELMCDFVEAMNPGVKLVRNAIILKDRDISGELKDVWNAVQAQRDREREEQIILQRQQHQQHFHHNLNSPPTANNGTLNGNSFGVTATNSLSTTPPTTTTHQMFPKSLSAANSNETTALPTVVDGGTPPRSRKLVVQQVQNDYTQHNTTSDIDEEENMAKGLNSQVSLTLLAERLDNKLVLTPSREEQQKNELQMKHQHQHQQQHNQNILLNDDALSNGSLQETSGSGGGKNDINNQLNAGNCKKEQRSLKNGFATSCNDAAEVVINVNDTANTTVASDSPNTPAQIINPVPVPATPPVQQTPTKKEKLGGFLPNGCIFPRFTKNNKYKDKDKDKEKEKDSKPKDKEKNALLSALKKSKDKKSSASIAAAVNNDENNTSSNTNNTAVVNNCFNQQTQQTSFNKQQKNCLPQLECGVQKLDLKNHHHHHHPPHNAENSSTTTTTTTNTTTKNNAANKTNSSSKNSGVGVH